MVKIFCSVLILSAITITSFGQTAKTQLDQVKANPQTTQNAARADAQVVNQKATTPTDNSTATMQAVRKLKLNKINSRKKHARRSR
jgi:hypothetical protein